MVFGLLKKIFRKDPIKNYLLGLLTFAVSNRANNLYFYIDGENIRVFFDPKEEPELYHGLKSLPRDAYEKIRNDILGLKNVLEPLIIPEGLMELTTTPRKYNEGLETLLARKFGLRSICYLGEVEIVKKLKISKQKINVSLSKIPDKEGLGYHLKFYHKF